MTFEKIHSDTDCNCLSNAETDTTNEFVRKLRKQSVEPKDFLSHWEREIRPENSDCTLICSYKGISINQVNPEVEKQVIEKYKTTFNFNPKKGAYYLKFKLNDKAGKVAFAPEEDDPSHYNLYKADDFSLDNLVIVETVKFA